MKCLYFFIIIVSIMLGGFHTEAMSSKLEEPKLALDERKFAKLIQADTIWNHLRREEQKVETSGSPVRTIFELNDRVFTYKGTEGISTPEEKSCIYTKSATDKGSSIKIIYNSNLTREEISGEESLRTKIINYFTEIFYDQILQTNYHQQLRIKVREVITSEFPDFYNPKTYQLYEKPNDAVFEEAMSLYNQEKYVDALPLFLESHEENNGNATFILGQLYGSGKLSEQADYKNGDRKKAAEYIKEGALRHNAASQFTYGIFHFDKNFPQDVIREDFNKAFAWSYLSATQGFVPAIKFTYEFHKRFLPELADYLPLEARK